MKKSALMLLCSLIGLQAGAAVITWQGPANITGDASVLAESATLESTYAINGFGTAVTINGVDFSADDGTIFIGGNDYGALFLEGSTDPFTPSAEMATLLETTRTYSSGALLTGLTDGTDYTVQFFCNDSRAAASAGDRATIFNDGLGNLSAAVQNSYNDASGIGQYIVGTFTAIGATQAVSWTGTLGGVASGDGISVNGLGLYETIPEPATLGLVVAMGGGILFIRRRFMI